MFNRFLAVPSDNMLTLKKNGILRIYTLVICLALLLVSLSSYAGSNDVPTRNEVQNQLDTFNRQKNLTPVDKLSQQDLIHTLEYLDALDRVKQDATQLHQQVTEAPQKLRAAIDGLDQLKKQRQRRRQ